MTPGCPAPPCPVVERDDVNLRRLTTIVWSKGKVLHRGHRTTRSPVALVPGHGDTRFAPMQGAAHVYVAGTRLPALLESVLHSVSGPVPAAFAEQVAAWSVAQVALLQDVRLIDLRDPQLERLGMARSTLINTDAEHYGCTRSWAQLLHGRSVGGRPTHGLIWDSRQRELHAHAISTRPAMSELVGQLPAEVAVLWSPPASSKLLKDTGRGLGSLASGAGQAYLTDLAAALGIVVR